MTERQEETTKMHENVIFSCFGGFSNTGITSAMASLDAVKELGLAKASIGCLAGLPLNIKPILNKSRAAEKIITVDGCPKECARKLAEQAGLQLSSSIVLTRDIEMKKKPFHEDLGGDVKGVMEYVSADEIQKAKELIVSSILKE